MRALILSIGSLLASGFALLGILVALMGEGQVPVRRGSAPIDGLAAYTMGLGWIAFAVTILCIALVGAEVGPKYYLRIVRDWAFLGFAVSFIVTIMIAVHKTYGPIAL